MTILFETKSLSKYYRTGTAAEVRALDEISIAINAGSVTVVTGPSGSGKTTLIALLGALERPTRGQVVLEGRDLGVCSDVELARIRRRIGFIFQDFSLISGFSVLDNITYPLIPRGISRTERQERARNLLARLSIEEKLHVRAGELSGGEQQRVAIARALAGEPDAVIADEPTSNLDRDTGQFFLDVVKELHAGGKTIVLTSHDPEVFALATQVIELKGGRLAPPSHGPSA